jgi:hypothetical protein
MLVPEKTLSASFSVPNNQPGASTMADTILEFMHQYKDLSFVTVALESTSYYGIHIANYLSSCTFLLPFNITVYCVNPMLIHSYKKTFVGMNKNDYVDAFAIADFARVGKITSSPWCGSQFLALQRLTRHRLHLAKSLTSEKTYMLSNIFLKFSQFPILDKDSQPFSNKYNATAASVLTDFLSTDEIADMPLEKLVDFICDKGKKRFSDPEKTAVLLQKHKRALVLTARKFVRLIFGLLAKNQLYSQSRESLT